MPNMKPILFNTEMVRAILDDRKTVTRRVVKLKYDNTRLKMKTDKYGTRLVEIEKEIEGVHVIRHDDGTTSRKLLAYIEKEPPYKPGDILYVRETWNRHPVIHEEFIYKADGCFSPNVPWRPSIHMPKEAARLFLRVTDVRVERLLFPFYAEGSSIFELQKEGVGISNHCRKCIDIDGKPCCIEPISDTECVMLDRARNCFKSLWDSTIKPSDLNRYGWDANPWVWVIEFEKISKEEAMK